jgi:hypothetical protein
MEQTNWRCVSQKVAKVSIKALTTEVGNGTNFSDFPNLTGTN